MDLLLPFTMIGFGRYFYKHTPNEVNCLFGYRTEMSMKNKDTWAFAHNYCGKIWNICGIILLPVSVAVMAAVYGKSEDVIGYIGGFLCGIQMIPLTVSIIFTERALKRNFDKNGRRK